MHEARPATAKRARKKRTRNPISSGISRRQQLPQSRTWPQADAEDSSITIDGSSHQTSPIPLPHAICVCLISFFLPPGLGGRAVSVAFFPPRVCFRGRRGILVRRSCGVREGCGKGRRIRDIQEGQRGSSESRRVDALLSGPKSKAGARRVRCSTFGNSRA